MRIVTAVTVLLSGVQAGFGQAVDHQRVLLAAVRNYNGRASQAVNQPARQACA